MAPLKLLEWVWGRRAGNRWHGHAQRGYDLLRTQLAWLLSKTRAAMAPWLGHARSVGTDRDEAPEGDTPHLSARTPTSSPPRGEAAEEASGTPPSLS